MSVLSNKLIANGNIKKVHLSESDLMPARASLSGFAIPYHFSVSITCCFDFGHNAQI